MNQTSRKIIGVALLALGVAAFAPNNATRPAEDVARDADRKPAEMIAFAMVGDGQTVVDMLPGGGYFTRLFAQAVGSKGHVVALVPSQLAARNPKAATVIQDLAKEPAYANVTAAIRGLADIGADASVDRVWTSQNYHDLHNPALPADTALQVDKRVFAALKPGGYFVVLDHSAAAGSGLRDVSTLHRIDIDAVKAEVTAAGFKLDAESHLLANAGDDRSKNVFDPSVRGKTDQFILRFVKP